MCIRDSLDSVIDDPDLVHDLLQQPKVMGNHDDASLEVADGGGHGVDHLHISSVSRLIEEEDVGHLHGDLAEDETGLETVTHLLDGGHVEVGRDTVSTAHSTPLLKTCLLYTSPSPRDS
eukprot:TRINITY_DN3241_c0_g1_i7.p1 TRINITY_DN3241_c0_g1~~TRINITY_DN3241_c0_g1_i7.p1  ORF type:complete len:119 (+),score=27.25 TRINITY_DN3241_c0_g1_i7:71-427(+)